MSIIKKILLGFVIFIALIVGLVFIGTKGVDKAAEATLADFANGNVEKVYNESALTKEFTLEQFSNVLGQGAPLDMSKMTKIKWTGRGFNNGRKYIYGTFKMPDGSEGVLTFTFIKVDGKLKLFGIKTGAPETSKTGS